MAGSRTSVEEYLDAFRDRVVAMRRPGQVVLDEPGLLALLGLGADTLRDGWSRVAETPLKPVPLA